MVDEGELKNFLGLLIEREKEQQVLKISQKQYLLKVLKKFDMLNCNEVAIPMDPGFNRSEYENQDTKSPYRELIGSLLYSAYSKISSRND